LEAVRARELSRGQGHKEGKVLSFSGEMEKIGERFGAVMVEGPM
jgi:hypothetical protein